MNITQLPNGQFSATHPDGTPTRTRFHTQAQAQAWIDNRLSNRIASRDWFRPTSSNYSADNELIIQRVTDRNASHCRRCNADLIGLQSLFAPLCGPCTLRAYIENRDNN